MSERVCVFIDGANFYHQCKENLGRTDVNLVAFSEWLVGPSRTLVRTYFYTVPLSSEHPQEQREAKDRFLGALQRLPYLEPRLGKLVPREVECRSCGAKYTKWVEKGVDMRVGVDMVAGAAKALFDTAILVSRDGDFAEAVQAVKDLGKHVEVASFAKGRSDALVAASDLCRTLSVADMQSLLLGPASEVRDMSSPA